MIFAAQTLLMLFYLEFASEFPIQKNRICTIEFTRKKCHGPFECEWHAVTEMYNKKVKINLNHWNSIPAVHRKELLFHELGHCSLCLKHVNHVGIMRQRQYSTKLDGSNWRELLENMKKDLKNPNYRYKFFCSH